MKNELFYSGIYIIVNEKLNLVYVGQTQRCLILRWFEHIDKIPLHYNDILKTQLYLDRDTKFEIIKSFDKKNTPSEEYFKREVETNEQYRIKNWTVLSQQSYIPKSNNELNVDNNESLKAHKYAVKKMIKTLGLINTKQNNVLKLYKNIYTKINNQFNTNVYNRECKTIIESLTKEELIYAMYELFPRYRMKQLELYRKDIKFKE